MTPDDPRPTPAGQFPKFGRFRQGEDASLVAMRSAWIDFYDAEYERVVRFLMRTGACWDDARDAAQDAFLESWALMTCRPKAWEQIINPRAWIRTVAWRKHRRPPGSRRRLHLAVGADLPDLPQPGPEVGEWTAQTQAVTQALAGLNEDERMVMTFRMDGFTFADIAAELGINEQEARHLARRARAALKRTLAMTAMSGEEGPR